MFSSENYKINKDLKEVETKNIALTIEIGLMELYIFVYKENMYSVSYKKKIIRFLNYVE